MPLVRREVHDRLLMDARQTVIFPESPPGSAGLVACFNRGLRPLKASGRYAQRVDAFKAGAYLPPNPSGPLAHRGRIPYPAQRGNYRPAPSD